MKTKWVALAALVLLASTNAITLILLAKTTAKATGFRAELEGARIAAAKADSLQFELETTRKLLSISREHYNNPEREAMLNVIERWKTLYEDSQRPMAVGERINGSIVTSVSPSTITINEDGGKMHTLRIGEVSSLLRTRAALAMVATAKD